MAVCANGLTVLQLAAREPHAACGVLRAILDRGAPVSGLLKHVRSVAAVRLLVRAGADVNERDERGKTPLWHAVRGGYGKPHATAVAVTEELLLRAFRMDTANAASTCAW